MTDDLRHRLRAAVYAVLDRHDTSLVTVAADAARRSDRSARVAYAQVIESVMGEIERC